MFIKKKKVTLQKKNNYTCLKLFFKKGSFFPKLKPNNFMRAFKKTEILLKFF